MSVKVSSWVWAHSTASGNDKFVLLAIADHADHDGSGAWPSVRTLARMTGISQATVHRCISHLVGIGELKVERQMGGPPDMADELRPNAYTVIMSPVENEAEPVDKPGVTVRPGLTVTPTGSHPDTGPGLTVTPKPSFTRPRPSRRRSKRDPGPDQPPLMNAVSGGRQDPHAFTDDGTGTGTCSACMLPELNRLHRAGSAPRKRAAGERR